ncbi:MAG: transcriptional regulator with PAS, ATPase and Fis domain [Planctomycetota bacterium]
MNTPDANTPDANIPSANIPGDLLAAFDALLQRTQTEAPDLLSEMRARLDSVIADRTVEPASSEEHGWHGLIGECPPMLELRRFIERFAKANAPVLITGESGTGKERVAQAVHEISRRSKQAFVAENCAAIPATLLESVLFGHKRGAFTGAVADHPGHFVSAHRGTIFLDEIGEMPLPMQVKLLRALQEGEVRAVGDNKVRKVDVRVIAATNQDLENAVKEGRFREDLYFRINVLRLSMPPLRDRGDDITLLARRFLAEAVARTGRPLTLSDQALEVMAAARWPGNVRQLQNELLRLSALADGPIIKASELSPELAKGAKKGK